MAEKKSKLTARQKKFVGEYLKSGNATQSAIKAGYSKNSAKQIGSENLTKPALQKELEKTQEKQAQKFDYDMDKLFCDLKVAQDLARNKTNSVGETVPDLTNYIKATELMGKMIGGFTERSAVDTNVNVVSGVKIEVVSNERVKSKNSRSVSAANQSKQEV